MFVDRKPHHNSASSVLSEDFCLDGIGQSAGHSQKDEQPSTPPKENQPNGRTTKLRNEYRNLPHHRTSSNFI